ALMLGYTGQETLLQEALQRKRYEAYPYLLMCRILKNRIPEEKDIPEEMILRMKDDPLFLFCLELIRMTPEARLKYLRQTDSGGLAIRPSKEWSETMAETEFLRSVRRAAALSRPRRLCMIFPKQDPLDMFPSREPLEIFERIKSAADRGHPAAQYLTGKFYFHNDLPDPYLARVVESDTLPTAEKYLSAAAKRGSMPAALLLCRAKLAADFPKYQSVLPLLEDLCRRKIGEAFYLKAETLLHLDRKGEALAAAKQAIGNGDHRGWRILALHGALAGQRDCWRKFIAADREARKQDVYDFYWPEPYREYLKWEIKPKSGSGDAGFSGTPLMESLPKVSNTASEESSETGSKGTSKKTSRKKDKSRSKIKFRDE
ncbi:MAG: hypothetical protein IJS14_03460, partial [Lentisphaeria bacterium]|nr:hypothetical protein [Lentisphaeria bacterium]